MALIGFEDASSDDEGPVWNDLGIRVHHDMAGCTADPDEEWPADQSLSCIKQSSARISPERTICFSKIFLLFMFEFFFVAL